jgi:hypothetical protein
MLEIEDGHFRSLDDFVNFISHARDLTGLALFHIHTSSTDGEPLTPGDHEGMGGGRMLTWNNWGRLSDLTLGSVSFPSTVLVDWLLGPRSLADLSHVETLHIVLQGDAVSRLLHTIGSSLKHLELRMPMDFLCEWPPIIN